MKPPKLNSCCCGCSVTTGSKIIGWLSIVFGVLIMLYCCIALVVDLKDITPPEYHDYLKELRIIIIIAAVLTLTSLIFSLILIIGVARKSTVLLKIWIIYTIITTIVYIIGYVVLIIHLFSIGQTVDGITYIISLLIGIGLTIYFLLVVNSLCEELKIQDV